MFYHLFRFRNARNVLSSVVTHNRSAALHRQTKEKLPEMLLLLAAVHLSFFLYGWGILQNIWIYNHRVLLKSCTCRGRFLWGIAVFSRVFLRFYVARRGVNVSVQFFMFSGYFYWNTLLTFRKSKETCQEHRVENVVDLWKKFSWWSEDEKSTFSPAVPKNSINIAKVREGLTPDNVLLNSSVEQ